MREYLLHMHAYLLIHCDLTGLHACHVTWLCSLQYHAISQSYYKGVHAIVAVYDVTDATSFEKMMGWVEEVQSCANKDVILWVVGNKADIKDLKQVRKDALLFLMQVVLYGSCI